MLRHNKGVEAAWAAAYAAMGQEPSKVPDNLLLKPTSSPGHPMPKAKGAPRAAVEPEKTEVLENEATLDDSLRAICAKWIRLRTVMAAVYEWRQSCRAALDDAKKEYSEICNKCQKYNKEYASLDSRIKEAQRLQDSMADKVKALETTISSAGAKIHELQMEIGAAQPELAAAVKENSGLITELTELRDQSSSCWDQYVDAGEVSKARDKDWQNAQEQVNTYNALCDALSKLQGKIKDILLTFCDILCYCIALISLHFFSFAHFARTA